MDKDRQAEYVARARAHPIRQSILTLLADRDGGMPATAVLHEVPDLPNLSTAAYHLRVLCKAELIKAEGDTVAPVYSPSALAFDPRPSIWCSPCSQAAASW